MVADFQSEYGHELEELYFVKSWSWFVSRLAGLLVIDSRLHRYFRDPDEPGPPMIDDEL